MTEKINMRTKLITLFISLGFCSFLWGKNATIELVAKIPERVSIQKDQSGDNYQITAKNDGGITIRFKTNSGRFPASIAPQIVKIGNGDSHTFSPSHYSSISIIAP